MILEFVESMTASTPRLVLHGGPWRVLKTSKFGFPESKQSMSGTAMTDGEVVSADSFGNRTLSLKWQVDKGDPDSAVGELQKLFRELAREQNMLKYRPNTTNPVWFKTFRTAPDDFEVYDEGKYFEVSASIRAEPFAYGAKEFAAFSQTINMSPTAGSNGMFIDLADLKGDVEMPAQLSFLGAQIPGYTSAIAVRRRGSPSATPFVLQAEAMTQGTNTTTQPNDAAMSGAGNNFSRCTFTTATMQTRLSTSVFPLSQSVDARGMYRVYARIRRSSGTGPIDIQLNSNKPVATPLATTIQLIELGEVAVPGGMDPITDGPSGVELQAQGAGLTIRAERTSGTSTLDYDCFLFFPADAGSDRFALVTWPTQGSGVHVFDNDTGMIYNADGTTGAVLNSSVTHEGLPIMLTPGPQTNRVFFVRKVNGLADALTDAVTTTIAYWPRYLYVAPVGS